MIVSYTSVTSILVMKPYTHTHTHKTVAHIGDRISFSEYIQP